MGKEVCSNCGNIFWVNLDVDPEIACPRCGYVIVERPVGQAGGHKLIHE